VSTLGCLRHRRRRRRDHDAAALLYRRAAEIAPENHELCFWAGLGAAQLGDLDEGVRLVQSAISAQPGWLELLGRLTPGDSPSAEQLRAQLSRPA
jgi:hypothetical protein